MEVYPGYWGCTEERENSTRPSFQRRLLEEMIHALMF